MFTNIINLFILTYNTENNKQVVVSAEENKYKIINIKVSDKHDSIEAALQELLESYVNIGFGWIKTVLVETKKQQKEIHTTFACTIPADTELKNGYYVGTNLVIVDPIGRKAINYV
jgi:hypothetical protein